MLGYSKARLFDDVETVRKEIGSAKKLQDWMQGTIEIALDRESADVLVVVFVVKMSSDGEKSRMSKC